MALDYIHNTVCPRSSAGIIVIVIVIVIVIILVIVIVIVIIVIGELAKLRYLFG